MRGKRIIVIAAVGAAFAVVVGVATGAIPGSGGEIQGCYLKLGGVLRVVDADRGQKCTRLEAPLSWNQQGAQGPQGEQGPQGPAGTFSGTFESPNEQYRLSVTNNGIDLAGPGGSVEIDVGGISIDATGPVSVDGALVQLNGCDELVNSSLTVCTGSGEEEE